MLLYICLLLIPYVIGGSLYYALRNPKFRIYSVTLEIIDLFVVDILILKLLNIVKLNRLGSEKEISPFLLVVVGGIVASLFVHALFNIIMVKTNRGGGEKAHLLLKLLVCIIIFAGSFGTLANRVVSVEIHSQDVEDSDYAQLFFDHGSGYTEAMSSKSNYNNGKATLLVAPTQSTSFPIRLDPIGRAGEFGIVSLSINLLNYNAQNYTADELYYILQGGTNSSIWQERECVYFSCDSDDPVCILQADFTAALEEVLLLGNVISLMLAGIIALFSAKVMELRVAKNVFKAIERLREKTRTGPAIIAAVHYFVCLWLQQLSFVFSAENFKRMMLCQIVFAVFLQILWQVIWEIWDQYKNGNPKTRSILLYSSVYFAIMFAMLLLIWPGYFVADEWVMVQWCTNWIINTTYGWFMHLLMILGMMMIPGVIGMEIFQIAAISLMVGYIFEKISTTLKYKKRIWIFYIPLCFPAVILNNFRLQRAVIGSYIELLLIFSLLYAFLNKETISERKCLVWAVLISLTATLRTEGLYYILLAPIVLYVLFKKTASKRKIIATTLCVVAFSLVFVQIENLQGQTAKKHANIINFGRLLYTPLKENGYQSGNREIEAIDKVIDVEQYIAAENLKDAMSSVREGANNLDQDTISDFVSASIKMILRHPKAYLSQQLETYLIASGFTQLGEDSGRGDAVQTSGDMFDPAHYDVYPYSWSEVLEPFYENEVNRPISQTLRKWAINFCQGRSPEEFETVWPTSPIFMNVLIPTLALLLVGIKLLMSKKWEIFLIWLLFSARIGVLFLIEPYPDFTYWTRVVVAGNLILAYAVIQFLNKKRLKNA